MSINAENTNSTTTIVNTQQTFSEWNDNVPFWTNALIAETVVGFFLVFSIILLVVGTVGKRKNLGTPRELFFRKLLLTAYIVGIIAIIALVIVLKLANTISSVTNY